MHQAEIVVTKPFFLLSFFVLLAICGAAIAACGEKEPKNEPKNQPESKVIESSGNKDTASLKIKVAELSGNKNADPLEMISAFVALAVSRDPETCQYLSPEYRKSASRDLRVPEEQICETLFPDAPSKIKAESTVVISKDKQNPKAISAVCTTQKTTPPDPPKNAPKKVRKQIEEIYAKGVWQQVFSGPLITEIVFSEERSQWEMLTLPANTTFPEKGEQKIADRVSKEVKQDCPRAF